LTIPKIIERFESVIRELDTPPIIIGHSAGGAFTQIMLDHGYGAAGVAINSAPTEGVLVAPLTQLKSTAPAFSSLSKPAQGHRVQSRAVGTTRSRIRSAMTSRAPCTSGITCRHRARSCGAACSRTFSRVIRMRGSIITTTTRAPLLFLSGAEDHLMPAGRSRSRTR
jgi:pimeloyl-ACP methyl ester carboxylesterase